MKKYLSILLVFIAFLPLSSCEDDPEYSGLSGRWEMIADQWGAIPERDIVQFTFYNDLTGSYGYYDNYGQWYEEPTRWTWNYYDPDRNIVNIYFADGEQWSYYYYFDRGFLYLEDMYDYNKYYQLRPVY